MRHNNWEKEIDQSSVCYCKLYQSLVMIQRSSFSAICTSSIQIFFNRWIHLFNNLYFRHYSAQRTKKGCYIIQVSRQLIMTTIIFMKTSDISSASSNGNICWTSKNKNKKKYQGTKPICTSMGKFCPLFSLGFYFYFIWVFLYGGWGFQISIWAFLTIKITVPIPVALIFPTLSSSFYFFFIFNAFKCCNS